MQVYLFLVLGEFDYDLERISLLPGFRGTEIILFINLISFNERKKMVLMCRYAVLYDILYL